MFSRPLIVAIEKSVVEHIVPSKRNNSAFSEPEINIHRICATPRHTTASCVSQAALTAGMACSTSCLLHALAPNHGVISVSLESNGDVRYGGWIGINRGAPG
jgi:hypothetical protein